MSGEDKLQTTVEHQKSGTVRIIRKETQVHSYVIKPLHCYYELCWGLRLAKITTQGL